MAISPGDYSAPMNAFFTGQAAATQQQNALHAQQKAKDDAAMRAIELVGSMALGAKGGKLDGPVDPAKYDQGLDFLAAKGIDVSKFKGRPETADVAAHAAIGALSQIKLGHSATQAAMQMQLQLMQLQQGQHTMQLQRAQFDRQRQNDQFNQGVEARKLAIVEKTAGQKETPAGFRVSASGGLEPIPGGPNDPAYIAQTTEVKDKGKKFNAGEIGKLSEEGGKYQSITGFGETFNDNFAGYGAPLVGNAAMTAGRHLPSWVPGAASPEAAQWWQGYDRYKNDVRKDLFGSALTATEQAAFERADINPGMKPDQIRSNLATQKATITGAMRRKAQALVSGGYDPEPVAAAYGLKVEDLGVTPKAKAGAPRPAQASEPSPDVRAQAMARIQELRGQGKSNEEIKAALRAEGLF